MAGEKKGAGIPESVKSWFLKFAEHELMQAFIKVLAKVGLGLTGPFAWLASFFIDKVVLKVWNFCIRGYINILEYFQTKKEVEEYKDGINKPNASADEISHEGDEFLSS